MSLTGVKIPLVIHIDEKLVTADLSTLYPEKFQPWPISSMACWHLGASEDESVPFLGAHGVNVVGLAHFASERSWTAAGTRAQVRTAPRHRSQNGRNELPLVVIRRSRPGQPLRFGWKPEIPILLSFTYNLMTVKLYWRDHPFQLVFPLPCRVNLLWIAEILELFRSGCRPDFLLLLLLSFLPAVDW